MKEFANNLLDFFSAWAGNGPSETYFDSFSISLGPARKPNTFETSTMAIGAIKIESQVSLPLPNPSLRTKDILVIEDDEVTRDALAMFLRSAGYHVFTATDGSDGLAQLSEHPHSLVFLDLRMPGMDGFEFMNQLQKHPELSDSRTVLVTGDEEAARAADGVGADGILRKPFELDSLLNYARTYCESPPH